MTKKSDDKAEALRQRGCLNPSPERVKGELFHADEFFDPKDLVQVKYEMLRRVRTEGDAVTRAARDFGFSRPSFYEARRQFEEEGLVGLVPRKRGPRGGHKLTAEVVDALRQALAADSSLSTGDLVELVRVRFGQTVHRRSVERALSRGKKKLLMSHAGPPLSGLTREASLSGTSTCAKRFWSTGWAHDSALACFCARAWWVG